MRIAILAVGVVAFALLGMLYAPDMISWLGGEAARIDYDRAERRLRADLGLKLPGEPDLERLPERLATFGVAPGAPVLVRIYKKEFQLELWMQRRGIFERFATYPICRWSGDLGPKLREGDAQAPEGFYTVDASALNPNSRYHRAFNVGFPNAFDVANGRTGSLIMVHGACASIGCFAMTNAQIDEIWRLVTAAFGNGQKRFQVQIYPFRMSGGAIDRRTGDPNNAFWRDLKIGSDLFEASFVPPKVMVCDGRYRFEAGGTGAIGDAIVASGCPAAAGRS